MPEPIKKEFTPENLPKTKEEWGELAKVDPAKFAELSQPRIDQLFRESREWKEKYEKGEADKQNLQAELVRRKVAEPAPVKPAEEQFWSFNNLPSTKQEWEELEIDDPVMFYDLRHHYNRTIEIEQTERVTNQVSAKKIVQAEHVDMYLPETDGEGKPKLDDKGKVILKRNAEGEPIFNPDSEKGKLWVQIYAEDPGVYKKAKNGPLLMMAEMERRLRMAGKQTIDNAQRDQEVEEGATVPPGVTPPVKSTGKFSSKEEEDHVKAQIARGIYKDTSDYFKNRDSSGGLYEENRRPVFGGKKA